MMAQDAGWPHWPGLHEMGLSPRDLLLVRTCDVQTRWLSANPLKFRWRRVLYEVTRAEGPERISGEWWRAPNQRTSIKVAARSLQATGGVRFSRGKATILDVARLAAGSCRCGATD